MVADELSRCHGDVRVRDTSLSKEEGRDVGQPTLGEKSEDVEDMKFEEKSEDV